MKHLWIKTYPLSTGQPGGTAAIKVTVGNSGLETATGVTLKATLSAGLTYIDCSVVAPSNVNGNEYTWTLSDLAFTDSGNVIIWVSIPGGDTIGTLRPVTLTIAPSDANPSDNQASTNVMTSLMTFLPLTSR